MATHTQAGIDVGTHHVKVVITCYDEQHRVKPRIIGRGYAESRGLRHGYIVNTSEVTDSVKRALAHAQKSAKTRVDEAYVSVGGVSVEGIRARATTGVNRGDNEITDIDIAHVHKACEQNVPSARIQNRRIIHTIPLWYAVDGEPILGSSIGMNGQKLECQVLLVTAIEPHVNDLVEAVEAAGVDVVETMAAPIAAGIVTLSKNQRVAGCVLANIGAETVSIVVYENNVPISLEVFSIGSTDITNDIALGLKIPLEEAQRIKHGTDTETRIPRRKLDEIITARLADIFELIDAHLRTVKRQRMLPAGIVIIGGGSALPQIGEKAKQSLELPAHVAGVTFNGSDQANAADASWAVAYGLCVCQLSQQASQQQTFRHLFTRSIRTVARWIKQFLP